MKQITLKIIMCLFASGMLCNTTVAQVTIGYKERANTGALVDIKQFGTASSSSDGRSTSYKGVNLPRVALIEPGVLEPCATTTAVNKEKYMGLSVYNTTSSGALTPGIYYWNGQLWIRLVTEVPSNSVNIRDLRMSAVFPAGTHYSPMMATELDFGEIRIPEDGSYAFLIRIFGSVESDIISTLPFPYKQPLYLFIMKNGVLVDAQELQENVLSKSHWYGITGVLTAPSCQENDVITIRISKYPDRAKNVVAIANTTPGAVVGARTSIVFWKL